MKLTKRGPYYWVDFRDPSGVRRRLTTGETDEAKAYTKAGSIVQMAMVAPQAVEADPRPTLNAALEATYASHWSRGKSADSMRYTVNLLQREFTGVKLADVKTKMLRAYCEKWLAAGLTAATVNRRVSSIGVVLTRACEDDDTMTRPKMPHYQENNKKERYMSPAEEAAIMGYVEKRTAVEKIMGGLEWEYVGNLVVLLVDTGFRFSEAFVFYVDGTQACLGDSKNGKARRVPMTTRAQAAAAYVLASPEHAKLCEAGMKKAWEWADYRFGVATAAAACDDITLHILRHTCASRLIQRGVGLYTVSKWLGHSSVKVTERYAHLAPDSLSQALAALEGRPVATLHAQHGTQLLQQNSDSPGNVTLRIAK